MNLSPPPRFDLREIALFLDYDGTLVPYAAELWNPQRDPKLPGLLEALSDGGGGATAMVSGRSVAEIDRLIAPVRLPVSGMHGAELRRDREGKIEVLFRSEAIDELVEICRPLVAERPGLRLERKPLTLRRALPRPPRSRSRDRRPIPSDRRRTAGRDGAARQWTPRIQAGGRRQRPGHCPFHGRRIRSPDAVRSSSATMSRTRMDLRRSTRWAACRFASARARPARAPPLRFRRRPQLARWLGAASRRDRRRRLLRDVSRRRRPWRRQSQERRGPQPVAPTLSHDEAVTRSASLATGARSGIPCQSPGPSPFGDLLLQRLCGVGRGFALCRVRDGGSIAKLSVFAERPAETAVAQKIGFNRDREGVIFDHFDTMRPGGDVFQRAAPLSIANGSAV